MGHSDPLCLRDAKGVSGGQGESEEGCGEKGPLLHQKQRLS